ncbi:MAG: hypothetical protein RLZZ299_2831, partial [Pseudomonadota bacterium]
APLPLGLLGPLYAVCAIGAGVWFLRSVAQSLAADDPSVDYRVFKVSIGYLFIVFGAMLVECVLRAVWPEVAAWAPFVPLWPMDIP